MDKNVDIHVKAANTAVEISQSLEHRQAGQLVTFPRTRRHVLDRVFTKCAFAGNHLLRARYLLRKRPAVASVRRYESLPFARPASPVTGAVGQRRLAALKSCAAVSVRGGPDAARSLRWTGGDAPRLQRLLEHVQIDRTVIDPVVINAIWLPPGRHPYLAVASGPCHEPLSA